MAEQTRGFDASTLRTFEEGADYAEDLSALLARGPGTTPQASRSPSQVPSLPPGNVASPVASPVASRQGSTVSKRSGRSKGTSRKPVPVVRKGRTSAAKAGEQDHISRILYLPVDLIERMRLHRGRTGQTNTQIALRAINAHWREVTRLADAEQSMRVIPGDLFDDLASADHTPKRQVEITPTKAQLAAIEPLVDTPGVRDRSHLFTLVIRTWLDQPEQQP